MSCFSLRRLAERQLDLAPRDDRFERRAEVAHRDLRIAVRLGEGKTHRTTPNIHARRLRCQYGCNAVPIKLLAGHGDLDQLVAQRGAVAVGDGKCGQRLDVVVHRLGIEDEADAPTPGRSGPSTPDRARPRVFSCGGGAGGTKRPSLPSSIRGGDRASARPAAGGPARRTCAAIRRGRAGGRWGRRSPGCAPSAAA